MPNILGYLKFIRQVLVHKYYVLVYGLRLNVSFWQLLVHDLSKFSSHEMPFYVNKFFGPDNDPMGFSYAWRHHWNTNYHHPEFWNGGEMREEYVREMVADWLAARTAYEPERERDSRWPQTLASWPWFQMNFAKLKLHENTRALVLELLKSQGLE